MLNLNEKEWKTFTIGELFNISGTTTTVPKELLSNGNVPRITCAATNNGLDDFYQNEPTEKGGVITVDSATIGFTAYQAIDFIATDHVEKIDLNIENVNHYVGLFVKQSIDTAILKKYNYGYKFSQKRIKRQKILLPVDSSGRPDFAFMEKYMRDQESKKLEKYIEYIENIQKELDYIEIPSLKDKTWREFHLIDIFNEISRGRRLITSNQLIGTKPYVSSSAINNGVDNFIGNTKKIREFSNCISLANSGSVGAAFYHPYSFVASDHVTHLKNNNFNRYVYIFITSMLNRLSEKYNFNREINDYRIKREKILLPVNEENTPDYKYMEQYTKNIMFIKLKKYMEYIKNKNTREK